MPTFDKYPRILHLARHLQLEGHDILNHFVDFYT